MEFSNLLEELRNIHITEVSSLRRELSTLKDGLANSHIDKTSQRDSGDHKGLVPVVSVDAAKLHGVAQVHSQEKFEEAKCHMFGTLSNPEPFHSSTTSGKVENMEKIAAKTESENMTPASRTSDVSVNTSISRRMRDIITKTSQQIPFSSSSCPIVDRVRLRLRNVLLSPWFETGLVLVISCNALFTALEVQYRGMEVAYDINFYGNHETAKEEWPDATSLFSTTEWVFGIIYSIELVFKFVVLLHWFFYDPWNWLDFLTVACFVFEKVHAATEYPVSVFFVRFIRLIRIVRLIRFVRILQIFDALFLMVTAIKGSLVILGWALLLLGAIHLILATMISQMLHGSYFSVDGAHTATSVEKDMFQYFGTTSRALITLFELTFANWATVCRFVSENVSQWCAVLFILHKLFVGFAVIGVINAVFMQETFRIASSDNEMMVRQKQKKNAQHAEKMRELFSVLDTNGDNLLSFSEFKKISQDSQIRAWLGSMDLDPDDSTTLFHLLDADKDGFIGIEEMVKGVSKVKGSARSIDTLPMFNLHKETHRLHTDGSELLKLILQRLDGLAKGNACQESEMVTDQAEFTEEMEEMEEETV